MTKNKWRIPTISTDMYAEEFAKLLRDESNKTFFLQGKWGSGKTEYLKNVEKKAKDNLNFVYLELWKPDFNESLSRQLFDATHPKLAKTATIVGHALVTLTIVCSLILAIKGVISKNLPNYSLFTVAIIIAAIVTNLFSLTTNKVINVDKFLMSWSIKMLKGSEQCCPNVLIIDDFDRLNKSKQMELYKLFNAIQKGMSTARIIFVGNLNNIKNIENNFLDKIIDQVIALPFVLSPQSFSNKLVEIISSNLNEDLSSIGIEKLFMYEHRTLREANHFLSYVEDEFFRQEKKGRVQTDQELLIIYLYLFHRDRYQKLYEDWQKEKNRKELNSIAYNIGFDNLPEIKIATKQNDEDELGQYINKTLDDNNKYPLGYQKNQIAYFLTERSDIPTISNLIISIQNTEIIKPLMFSQNNDHNGLYQKILDFLSSDNFDDYFLEIMPQLLEAAIFSMNAEPRHTPTSLVITTLLNYEKTLEKAMFETNYMKSPSEQNKILFPKMNKKIFEILKKINNEASLTELLYIYRSCLTIYGTASHYSNDLDTRNLSKINRYSLTRHFSEQAAEIEKQKDFGKNLYDAEALLVQLCFKSPKPNVLDDEYNSLNTPPIKTKAAKIEQLADFEYVAFWDCYLGLGTRAKGEKSLNFKYENEIYGDYVYNRYKQIKQTACSLLKSNKGSELKKILYSRKWFAFFLRIAAITHQYNVRKEISKKVILNKLDQLLNSYNEKEINLLSKRLNGEISDDVLLSNLQDLLRQVQNNPDWVSRIK